MVEHVNGKKYAFDNFRELAGLHLEGEEDDARPARPARPPGSALIAIAAWLLALIGAGALYVSFTAQQRYVFAVRHQDVASAIEALLLDLLMIVFTLLAPILMLFHSWFILLTLIGQKVSWGTQNRGAGGA